jgi:hypothetical protein
MIEGAQFEAVAFGIGGAFEAALAPGSDMVMPEGLAKRLLGLFGDGFSRGFCGAAASAAGATMRMWSR